MQSDIDTLRIQAPQQAGPGLPRPAADQAGNGVSATHPGQAQRSVVDPGVEAEIVDADADRACAGRVAGEAGVAILGASLHRPIARARLAWFIAVGCVAAAVHWGVVVWLVGHAGWHPLVANGLGWLIAFGVSFAGHHGLSFRGHGAPPGGCAARFFFVSAGGFAVNEASYALLLSYTGQRFDGLLAAVLVAVAGVTYLLSRHWVFLRNPAR